VIPLLFFATCGAPEISDDWIDDFDSIVVEDGIDDVESGSTIYQVEGDFSGDDSGFTFEILEGWQAVAGGDELIAEARHLSSGTLVSFFRYDLSVLPPVPRVDCDWGYVDPEATSPFGCVDKVTLTSCLLEESGDRVQAMAFEHDGVVWQVEARFRVGYLAPGIDATDELFSGVTC